MLCYRRKFNKLYSFSCVFVTCILQRKFFSCCTFIKVALNLALLINLEFWIFKHMPRLQFLHLRTCCSCKVTSCIGDFFDAKIIVIYLTIHIGILCMIFYFS